MSMFDYDARPVTPGVVLVGTTASRGGYAIRDFLSRNGYPFEWVDAGQPEAVRAVLGTAEVEPSALPQYLIDQVSTIPNVDVRVRTQVAALEAGDRLRAVMMRSGDSTEPVPLPADALFICIGGVPRTPRTDGAAGIGLVTNTAEYLMTGSDAASDPGGSWPLPREPLPLETNLPGVFAAGDVRCGSVKRCAAAIGEGTMAVALVHRRLAEVGGD
jgi:thioredoxin reductase